MITLKIRNKYCVWKTIDTDEREWSRKIWYVLYTNKNVKPLSKIKKLGDLQYRYISCLSLSLSFNIVFISVLSLMLSRHLSLSHSLLYCTFIMPLKSNSCETAIISKIFISIQWQSKINEILSLVRSIKGQEWIYLYQNILNGLIES